MSTTCRFRDESYTACDLDATFFVSIPNRHKFPVCDEHVKRYLDPDGIRGRKRFDGRYIIEKIEEIK